MATALNSAAVAGTGLSSAHAEPHTGDPRGAPPEIAWPTPIQPGKANILLVDDRPDKLLALEAVLEKLGQNIVKAHSGKAALRCLLQQDFAVILLDVSMPGMDGFETAALIRTRLRSERTPIIFITSFGSTETHITRGYSLGAVDYLLTPIVPEVLRTKVSVFVELFRQTELIRQQAEQLRAMEEARHQRELAAVADRLEIETRRNRFFTLAVDLLGIADFTPQLVQVNPTWEAALGYEPSLLCSQSFVDFVHPEDREAMLEILRKGREDGLPVSFEGRFMHKDGSTRWLSLSLVPFTSEALLYLFAKDVTARKESENEIRRLNGELQDKVNALTMVNNQMEALNYSIAHDLRAPLRSMSSFATALLEDEADKLSPQGAEFATRITRSAKYMDRLLQDLLLYSRVTKSQVPLEDVFLETELKESLALLAGEIEKCGATIERCFPLDLVRAHATTVRQIINNLVDNALKFRATDRATVLRFYTTRNGDCIRLWVEDNGIGIPEEHQEKIFGIFRRLHPMDAYPGTGIGLAIVRRAAEQMGGSAGVTSVLGKGSKFWVEFLAPGK